MKRDPREYGNYKLYDELKALNQQKYLGRNQLLVYAAIYNNTSKGTGPLERGLMINAMLKVCKQHCNTFNVPEKKINKKWFNSTLNSLVECNFVKTAGVVKEMQYGKIVTRPNYQCTQESLEILKRLNLQEEGKSAPNRLF